MKEGSKMLSNKFSSNFISLENRCAHIDHVLRHKWKDDVSFNI